MSKSLQWHTARLPAGHGIHTRHCRYKSPESIAKFLAVRAQTKWHEKFASRPGAAEIPAAIALTLLKGQEHMVGALIRDEIMPTEYVAPEWLWDNCPSLEHVWVGVASWDETAHRPTIIVEWKRP